MPWVKIDDQFHNNPKVAMAGSDAVSLYIVALSWAGCYLTDGFIPKTQVRRLALCDNYEEATRRLVEVGLWHEVDNGYQINDYLEYNPSADEAKAKQQIKRRRWAMANDKELRQKIRARDGDICRYCGKTVNWQDRKSPDGGTYDHIVPITEGGQETVDNLVVCCRECNAKKGAQTPEQADMPLQPAPLNEESDQQESSSDQAVNQAVNQDTRTRSRTNSSDGGGNNRPPAIKVFRENAHRFPAKSWWDDVDKKVGRDPPDLEFWGRVVKAYVGQGWNPTNVKNMLKFYEQRRIPGEDEGDESSPYNQFDFGD